MKKVLIHIIAFYPDGVSTAYLYNDIATGLLEAGFEVTVLTTTPHYNYSGKINRKNGFEKRFFGLFYESEFQGIRILHVPQRKFGSTLLRLAGFIYWHIVSFILGLFIIKFDIVLSPSPPLTIGLVSVILAKIKNARAVYNVQEIYPDLLINQNGLKSGLVISSLKRLEKLVYNLSDMVITIDRMFFDQIVSRFKDPAKLQIIPNFVDTDLYKPVDPYDKFVNGAYNHDNLRIMYAGNIGHAQDWALLVETAKNLKELPVDFYVIGDGAAKEVLLKEISSSGLENIRIFPYQNRELMPGINSFADAHMIFMNKNSASQGFPSKVYTILACGKPVIAASTRDSPLMIFLSEHNLGFLSSEYDIDRAANEITAFIRAYIDDRELLKIHSGNARRIILERFSKHRVVAKYVETVRNVLK